jgi:hypothetical protein
MFGYVVANPDKLTPEEKKHYRSGYCGLCEALGKRQGTISRATLTYDMTFLVLLLSALYKNDATVKTGRCFLHPWKDHEYWQNEFTDYAADMNLLFAYYNFLDDWADDRKILSLCEAKLFERRAKAISARYPNKTTVISECLHELSRLESSGELNPDIPANCFGKLMSELFVYQEDEYADALRKFGKALGKFIYIMDACLDLKADIKKERYNPLYTTSSANFRDILNLLMADCTETYKQLPIERDRKLMDNILYSGVWTRYEIENRKTKERPER